MHETFLSVVIPVYDGEALIQDSVARLLGYLSAQKYSWEIIIVNDGSADRTHEIARGIAAREPRVRVIDAPHAGKGAAVRRGMLDASGKWRFMCDVDLSMPPEFLARFFSGPDGMPRFDVSLGSREARGARRIGEPLRRHFYGRLFNYAVRLVTLPGIKDTQCGFKLFSEEAVKTAFPRQVLTGFGFDVEVLFLCRKAGFTIGEIPIDWHYGKESKMTVRKGGLAFLEIVKVRLNDLSGKYRAVRRAG